MVLGCQGTLLHGTCNSISMHTLPLSQLYPWISPLSDSQRSLAHPAPRLIKYLHSLVIHSESSRHEAPMGLRETPLQNGVILRDLFGELNSGTGEPLTYRTKAYPLQVGKHPPSAKHPGCRKFNSISQGWVWLRIPRPLLYPAYMYSFLPGSTTAGKSWALQRVWAVASWQEEDVGAWRPEGSSRFLL